MADTKITGLAAIGANPIIPSTFPLPMVDLTDTSMAASGTTKKVTVNQILGAGGIATLASATITGDLTVDTSTLKVDSANNRVGILTASPQAELDVRGGANIGDGTTTVRVVTASNVGYVGTSTNDPLVIRTNAVDRARFDTSGNLGLGVTPAAAVVNNRKLEIAGDINSAVVLGSKSANASARNWATASNWNAYGDLVFLQSNAVGGDPLAAGTTRMTLNSNGALVLQGGTAAANGVGIAFPATQAASSDANTLDDYEEGTWTPTVDAETGTIGSTSIISANYTKIGRLVSVTFDIRVITAGTGSGGLKVSLPFSPSLGGQTCGAGREYINTGNMLQISKYDATNVLVYFYNNTTMIADNNRVMAGYTYFI